MSTSPDPRLSSHPEGRQVPLRVVLWNLAYQGEVARAEKWHPSLATGLPPGAAFRLVILSQRPQRLEQVSLADSRIAVCLPQVSQALRERRSSYQAAPEASPRQEHLPSPADYARGTVLRAQGPSLKGEAFFSRAGWGPVLESLAAQVVQDVFPPRFLGGRSLPRLLTAEEIPALWRGLVRQESDPAAREAVHAFALPLGLAAATAPERLDLSSSPVGGFLGEALARGERSIAELESDLFQQCGLPSYLAPLYLLAFLCHSPCPWEATLAPGHGLQWLAGEPFPAERLRGPLAPTLVWNVNLPHALSTLGPAHEPTWESLRPYLQQLSLPEEVEPDGIPEELRRRGGEVHALRQPLAELAEALGRPSALDVSGLLSRAKALTEVESPGELWAAIQTLYPSFAPFQQETRLYAGLRAIARAAADILAIHAYLEAALLGEGQEEMEVERQAVLQQLSLEELIRSPSLWPGLQEQFALFRSRYGAAYRRGHRAYYAEAQLLYQALQEAERQAQALRRLNAIAELGPSVGTRELQAYSRFLEMVRPCPMSDGPEIPLDRGPFCPACAYALPASSPKPRVQALLRGIERALAEQYRRLSSQTIKQILLRSGGDGVSRFLQVVGASDLSALAQIMDDDLAAFLQEMLRAVEVQEPESSLFEALRAQFPTLGDEDINVAAAEFAALARDALTRAQAARPDRPVRIRLT